MKISKLFHWLYAILMLLPLMVFIPNAFYYGFNKEAVAQEKTEQVPVYYDTNEVNSKSDLIYNNIYHWSNNYTDSYQPAANVTIFHFSWNSINGQSGNLGIYTNGNVFITAGYVSITSTEMDFVFDNIINTTDIYWSHIIPYITNSTLQVVKEYQPMTTNMSITDSMSYAWDSVWQNDLFSWSYGSFLTQPFIYIGNLFNVPVDNTLYYALSYWLDISIIWLTFDLLMYVPLLVHRWLDKGIIE